MSWLEDSYTDFKYICADCNGHISIYEKKSSDELARDAESCLSCGLKTAEYAGFLPKQMTVITKVAYEQNGRMAYRITDGKGGVAHISQTKYNLKENGTVDYHYSKAYEEHLVKNGHSDLLTPDRGLGRGKATRVSRKEATAP
jgi:hypothetical protein